VREISNATFRDQLLFIGIEWKLELDRLDQQSAACLQAIAVFLR
jgi:hypothetical protein